MKNLTHLYLLPLAFSILACSGEKEEAEISTPLSEQSLEFEIYDSLVVDYLGSLSMMDISPDGNSILMIDMNTDTIFVSDKSGKILYKFKKYGDAPGNYTRDRYGVAVFASNQEFLIPSTSGIYRYSLNGDFVKKYKPEFEYFPTLIITSGNSLQVKDGKAYTNYGGRYNDEFGRNGIDYQQKSTQLEVLDLETGDFSGVIPFPETSKFSSSELAYQELFFYPSFRILGDSLYLSFRNEPKIFTYSVSDLSSPASVRNIPFREFIEKSSEGKELSNGFNFEDLVLGTINNIIPLQKGGFLIDYTGGLTKEKYDQALKEAEGQPNKIWPFAEKLNTGGHVLFDGNQISSPIEKPTILGNMNKYVSKDEIWFSLNFSEAENDYSVIYKTRLVTK
ncbi:hypothetical protein LZF95_22185 [Algoriphagus sp. AGSA1]|uniref:hypothetical protein n=1 Tax=Algoriphagus sp. AGSA1 TaxID=2907213 RepID=UPI001F24AB56|nr:hypothetical protein [Algoriphagus sp. AGSA1]MCE7057407.1 hypothetical protein [Algoriphagus sp. AGSA1]